MFAAKNELFTTPSGYQIQRSLRFRSSATGYLSRTPSSTTNRRTWTWSGWMKRGSDKYSLLFAAGDTTDIWNTGTNCTLIGYWISTNQLAVYNNGTVFRNTAQVFRDPSAWYHIVVAFDTTQATAANRLRVYINGSEVTSWDTNNAPAQNLDMAINVNQNHFVGGQSSNVANAYFDGYMGEINFIDGQQLTPSSFGAINATTGVWSATKYAGTYGTNGFYLPFTDNSAATATTIGKDFSGNGNNWTPNNISMTAGVTYDSMLDAPLGAGGGERGNYCVLNPLAKNSSTSLTNGNLSASGNVIYGHAQSTIFANSGKWYFEAQLTTQQNDTGLGLGNTSSDPSGQYIGGDANSVGYLSDGRLFYNGSLVATYSSYITTDVVACAFDCATGKIWIAKNNTWQNSGDPAAGTGQVQTVSWTAFAALARTVGSGAISFNFGQRPFSYTPPTGFKALHTGNLGAPVIALPAQNMAATLWTGDGTSSRAISNAVNGVSFQPDWVWIKSRSNPNPHDLIDSVRGANKFLRSDATDAEGTFSFLSSFNSNGFTLGTNDNDVNGSGYTYVGWQWKAGGTAVSNTAGSITSSVSANASAGFSVVTYTGTGANATVGHGLGVAPGMVIVKRRNSTSDWVVYHSGLPSAAYRIWLNYDLAQDSGVAAAATWNSTAPTSTVFSVGTNGNSNASGDTYVAYCFAPVAGYSSMGNYVGNGSADGPFIYTGFRPRFVMIKGSSFASNWFVIDTSRSSYNVSLDALRPNLSGAETSTGTYSIDILSNGFKLRTNAADPNTSTATFIYAAFAEAPMKYALAR
jgi:hypothetical protein